MLPHETRADFLLNSNISHSFVVTVIFFFLNKGVSHDYDKLFGGGGEGKAL